MSVTAPANDDAARRRAVHAACLLLLAGVVVGGLVLRCVDLHGSLWMDELHTSWVVADGLAPVAHRAAWGNQPPLYFWLVALATGWLGHAEWTLRLPSLAAGTGLIVAGYAAVRVLSGSAPAALLAAVLLAVDRSAVFYAQEARPYALVQCGAVLHVLLFALLCQQPTLVRRAAWISLGAALWYCHYTFALMIVAQWVWLAAASTLRRAAPAIRAALRASRPAEECTAASTASTHGPTAPSLYGWRSLVCDAALLALAAAPSLPHVMQIARHAWQWEAVIPQPAPGDLLTVHPALAYLAAPAVLALLCGVAWYGTIRPSSSGAAALRPAMYEGECCRWGPWRTAAYLLTCYAAAGVVAYAAVWLTGSRIFYPRYLLPAAALLPLAAATLIAAAAPPHCFHAAQHVARAARVACRLGQSAAVVAVVALTSATGASVVPDLSACLASLDGHPTPPLHATGNYRDAIALVRQQGAATRQVVFLATGLVETQRIAATPQPHRDALADYLLFAFRGLYGLQEGGPLELLVHTPEGWFTPAQLQLLRQQRGGWCVADCVLPSAGGQAVEASGGRFPSDVQFRRALQSQAARWGTKLEVSLSGIFGGVYVYRLTVR